MLQYSHDTICCNTLTLVWFSLTIDCFAIRVQVCFVVDEEINGDAKYATTSLCKQVDTYGGGKQTRGVAPSASSAAEI
jgi:hypothetical protein